MTKEELIDKIEQSHSEWEAVLTEVGEDRMTEPGVMDDWSVKDIIAHLSSWQQRVLDRMDADGTGKPLEVLGQTVDEINVAFYARNRELPLKDVLAQARDTYDRFMERVRGLSQEQIFEPGHFTFTKDNPLYDWIAGDTFEHYDEHSASVRAWLK
jgi:hypothetical protein